MKNKDHFFELFQGYSSEKHIKKIHSFLLMSRRVQARNQAENQAENQPIEEWRRGTMGFVTGLDKQFESMNTRMDKMEKSMNTRMDKMEESIKDSINTFKQSFSQKAIGILFRDFEIQ